jgi:hypothetical protein
MKSHPSLCSVNFTAITSQDILTMALGIPRVCASPSSALDFPLQDSRADHTRYNI